MQAGAGAPERILSAGGAPLKALPAPDNLTRKRGLHPSIQIRNGMRPSDGVYRLILVLFALDVAIGAALVLAGIYLIESREVTIAGAGLTLVGAGLFLFFLVLGRRRSDGA